MVSIVNFWTKIVEWFQDRQDRSKLIIGFNRAAKEAFIAGIAPVQLEAKVSRGERKYRHQFSNLFNSGFRIKAYAGQQLSKQDTINIGSVILDNDRLVRQLVVLGFDTLEVHSDVGNYGCRWQLYEYIMICNNGGQNE